jgi:hypothetical protein
VVGGATASHSSSSKHEKALPMLPNSTITDVSIAHHCPLNRLTKIRILLDQFVALSAGEDNHLNHYQMQQRKG